MNTKDTVDLTKLRKKNVLKVYERDAVIASEGEMDHGWYVLVAGKVGVFKHDLRVAEFIQPGTVLGELSGILQRPRTATLKALEHTEVLYLNEGIEHLIVHHPDVTRKIIINLAERLAQTTEGLWTAIEKGDERSAKK